RRLGDGDPVSPGGAGERVFSRRGLRPVVLRLLRGRGPFAPAVSRGMALRVRACRALPPRGIAHRPADPRSPRALDRPQPLAYPLPQLRAAPSREEPPAAAARRPRRRLAARLAGGASFRPPLASPSGSRPGCSAATRGALRLG